MLKEKMALRWVTSVVTEGQNKLFSEVISQYRSLSNKPFDSSLWRSKRSILYNLALGQMTGNHVGFSF